MTPRYADPYDVDTDALAAKLHALADGIETDGILIEELHDGTHAAGDDAVVGEFTIQFIAEDSRAELLDMLSADVMGWTNESDENEGE